MLLHGLKSPGVSLPRIRKAELEAGVNLAADFIDHPFKAPFERVAAVRAQQAYETTAIKKSS